MKRRPWHYRHYFSLCRESTHEFNENGSLAISREIDASWPFSMPVVSARGRVQPWVCVRRTVCCYSDLWLNRDEIFKLILLSTESRVGSKKMWIQAHLRRPIWNLNTSSDFPQAQKNHAWHLSPEYKVVAVAGFGTCTVSGLIRCLRCNSVRYSFAKIELFLWVLWKQRVNYIKIQSYLGVEKLTAISAPKTLLNFYYLS